MNSRAYCAWVQNAIASAPHVVRARLDFDEIGPSECYLRGVLTLTGNCELHIAEYVITEPQFERLKYRYHLQRSGGQMIARWDNAPHHPELETHPSHLHTADGTVKESAPVDIPHVLAAAVPLITPPSVSPR